MAAAQEHPTEISGVEISAAEIGDVGPRQRPGRDVDPDETQEWRKSVAGVVDHAGRYRARQMMLSTWQRAREREVDLPGLRGTDYVNSIAPESEPAFPGDEHIERRIRAYIRWNDPVTARAIHHDRHPE